MFGYTEQGKGYRVELRGRFLGTVARRDSSRSVARGGRWESVPCVRWIATRPDGEDLPGEGYKTRNAAAQALKRVSFGTW